MTILPTQLCEHVPPHQVPALSHPNFLAGVGPNPLTGQWTYVRRLRSGDLHVSHGTERAVKDEMRRGDSR